MRKRRKLGSGRVRSGLVWSGLRGERRVEHDRVQRETVGAAGNYPAPSNTTSRKLPSYALHVANRLPVGAFKNAVVAEIREEICGARLSASQGCARQPAGTPGLASFF